MTEEKSNKGYTVFLNIDLIDKVDVKRAYQSRSSLITDLLQGYLDGDIECGLPGEGCRSKCTCGTKEE